MLRFSRGDAQQAPKKARIVDSAAAKAWLSGMAQPASVENLHEMTQVLQALGAMGVQAGAEPLPPERKFAIAERIRGVLVPILNDRAVDDRFTTLPLDDDFAKHFWATVDAAIGLRDVYAWLVSQLADAPVQAEATLSSTPMGTGTSASGTGVFISGIGALHRALDVNAQLTLWILRAHWAVPAAIWERHCVLGQLVRDLDCQDVEIADALRASITRTCRAAFVMPVLVALADPAARVAAEFQVVRMAAQRWSQKVGFRLERRLDGGARGPSAATPARPVANPGPTVTLGNFVLRFDTQSAMQSIDKRLEALADGKSPREVGIGDSLRPQVARDLLVILRQRWGAVSPGEIDSPDRAWRAATGGVPVTAVVGMPTRATMRRDNQQGLGAARPGQNTYDYKRGIDGGITRPREEIEKERVDQLLAGAETWMLDAESPDAVRCLRKYARPRIGLHRLIGLKFGGVDRDAPFLIGWVEAVQGTTVDGAEGDAGRGTAHLVRVRLAPGVPQLLHASVDDVELDCAFLLVPGASVANATAGRAASFVPMPDAQDKVLAALDADGWEGVRASPRDYGLILPLATFRPQRLVKAGRRGAVATLRLEELMTRGSDFDLVRFTPL